jgi:hypothetical protein
MPIRSRMAENVRMIWLQDYAKNGARDDHGGALRLPRLVCSVPALKADIHDHRIVSGGTQKSNASSPVYCDACYIEPRIDQHRLDFNGNG